MWHGPWSTAREVVMYFSHMTAIICDYLLPSVWGKLWHLVWIKTSRIHLQDIHYRESQNLQFSELWRLIIFDVCLFELCLKLMCKRCKSIPLYIFKPKSLLPLSYSSWKLRYLLSSLEQIWRNVITNTHILYSEWVPSEWESKQLIKISQSCMRKIHHQGILTVNHNIWSKYKSITHNKASSSKKGFSLEIAILWIEDFFDVTDILIFYQHTVLWVPHSDGTHSLQMQWIHLWASDAICILNGLRVSRFFRTFLVICPFKLHLLVRFAVIKEQPTTTISCSWTLSLFKAIKHISIKLPHSLLYFSSSQLCRANLMIRCHVSLLQAVCESSAL